MKDDFFDCAARGNGTHDMPEFVNRLHRKPTEGQKGGDQEKLGEAVHEVSLAQPC
jgi:hypothetical protein